MPAEQVFRARGAVVAAIWGPYDPAATAGVHEKAEQLGVTTAFIMPAHDAVFEGHGSQPCVAGGVDGTDSFWISSLLVNVSAISFSSRLR